MGSGKGSAIVAKQLSLEHGGSQRKTVFGDDGAMASGAQPVQCSGDQFFPGAAFTLNQYWSIRGRVLFDSSLKNFQEWIIIDVPGIVFLTVPPLWVLRRLL